MIIRPVGDYKERLRQLPFASIVSATITRMSESLEMLQDLDFDLINDQEFNTQMFILEHNSKNIILKTIITKTELFVMLYDIRVIP